MLTALFGVLVLGFLLGMRHAIDPDHVVAVTTNIGFGLFLAHRIGVVDGLFAATPVWMPR